MNFFLELAGVTVPTLAVVRDLVVAGFGAQQVETISSKFANVAELVSHEFTRT